MTVRSIVTPVGTWRSFKTGMRAVLGKEGWVRGERGGEGVKRRWGGMGAGRWEGW